MISLQETHILGVFINCMFAIALALMPISNSLSKKAEYTIFNRTRWMIVCVHVLFILHYVIHLCLEPRVYNEYYAALINIAFFFPAMIIFYMGVFNLIFFGRIKRWHVRMPIIWVGLVYMVLLPIAIFDIWSGVNHILLRKVEYGVSFTLICMLMYLCFILLKRYKVINEMLDSFYDAPKHVHIHIIYMCIAIIIFSIWMLTTPFVMFTTDPIVIFLHGMLGFIALATHTISFMQLGEENYAVICKPVWESTCAQVARLVYDSRETPSKKEVALPVSNPKVEQWLQTGHQFRAGISVYEIAHEIGITPADLRLYFRSHGFQKVGSWLAYLRVEEAKRLILAHKDYGFDAIAEMCGFSSREYFHVSFRNIVGMTPAQWQRYGE